MTKAGESGTEPTWGDGHEQQSLGRPSGSPARLLALFGTLGLVLLLVVIVKLGSRPPRDPAEERAVGKRLEKLELTPMEGDGEPLTLASLQGRVVLINFWGPWCPPCREEFPELMELREGLAKEQGFQFVSVTSTPTEDGDELVQLTKTFLKSQKYDLPIYRDSQLTTRNELKELNQSGEIPYPTTVLLDQRGVVRALWFGYRQGVGEQMQELIEKLLREPPK